MTSLKLKQNRNSSNVDFVTDEGKTKKKIEEDVDLNAVEALPSKEPIFGLYMYVRNLPDTNTSIIEKKCFQYGLERYTNLWCYLYDKTKTDDKLNTSNMKLCIVSYIRSLIEEAQDTNKSKGVVKKIETIESMFKVKKHLDSTINIILNDAGYSMSD